MEPLRLNLGCGLHAPSGWVNVDRSPNLLLDRVPPIKRGLHRVRLLKAEHMVAWPDNIKVMNVLRPFPYREGEVDSIYSSHMLEHLYFGQALDVLRECRRVLRPGGVLRLALPDALALANDLVAGSASGRSAEAGMTFTRHLFAHPLERPGPRERLTSLFASGPHRWQPTTGLVMEMLDKAGFVDHRAWGFRRGELPDLESVEHRDEGLFVEAVR